MNKALIREKILKQVEHHFYKAVDKYRDETKYEQMMKAAEKYDEPFNPDDWTNEALANHAMQENYDQSVYITGMRDRMRKQEETIQFLHKEISQLTKESEYWRLRALKNSESLIDVRV